MEFCSKLTESERGAGRFNESERFQLPTEAQREYACRAGSLAPFCYGENETTLRQFAWYNVNAWLAGEKYPHIVGQKRANNWGLHDMHGNVCEWCRDVFQIKLPGGSNPEISSGGPRRAIRGGAWSMSAKECRSAFRGRDPPDNKNAYLGFRIVRVMDSTQSAPANGSRNTAGAN